MNRPSLYGAFGDKRDLYIKSYQRYRDDARTALIDIFRDQMPIRKRLQRIYAAALDIYLAGELAPAPSGNTSFQPKPDQLRSKVGTYVESPRGLGPPLAVKEGRALGRFGRWSQFQARSAEREPLPDSGVLGGT